MIPGQAGLFEKVGRVVDAEKALAEGVQRRPGELAPWIALIRISGAARAAGGRSHHCAGGKEREVRSARARLGPGCYWAAEDRARADKAFKAALARNPDDPTVVKFAADYYEGSGRMALAEAALAEALATLSGPSSDRASARPGAFDSRARRRRLGPRLGHARTRAGPRRSSPTSDSSAASC